MEEYYNRWTGLLQGDVLAYYCDIFQATEFVLTYFNVYVYVYYARPQCKLDNVLICVIRLKS